MPGMPPMPPMPMPSPMPSAMPKSPVYSGSSSSHHLEKSALMNFLSVLSFERPSQYSGDFFFSEMMTALSLRNHLLSSDSISAQSDMFSTLYFLPPGASPSMESRPSLSVTETFSLLTISQVTKTFSERCAHLKVGVSVAMDASARLPRASES